MKRLEFHISYKCTHKCIFCSEAERMIKYENYPLSLSEIKTILIDRRKKWFDHINFTGWEATIYPNFLDLLLFTKKLWYEIYVGTSWTTLLNEKFSREFFRFIDELSLSIHFYDEKTCLEQMWSKEHFTNIWKIINNIEKYKTNQYFFLNIVINSLNYKNINKIIDFVVGLWYDFSQILVSYVAPEWDALKNYKKLSFEYNKLKKEIPKIVKVCKEKWKIIRFFWVPICILWEEFEDYSNDKHWQERHTIERHQNNLWKIVLRDIDSKDNSRERVFTEKCKDCKWKNNPCTWVFEKYLKFYDF